MAQDGIPAFDPPADVLVDETHVVVHMDVPGVSAGDIEIVLDEDVLRIRGRRTYPYDGVDRSALRCVERGFGAFERRLRVPLGLVTDILDATLADGVLTVRIPRPATRLDAPAPTSEAAAL